nr:DUF397 domain-containing protein [Streptomyces sp. LBL]
MGGARGRPAVLPLSPTQLETSACGWTWPSRQRWLRRSPRISSAGSPRTCQRDHVLPEPGWLKPSFSGEGGNNSVEIAATAPEDIALRENEAPPVL